jgi:hypothetical protein
VVPSCGNMNSMENCVKLLFIETCGGHKISAPLMNKLLLSCSCDFIYSFKILKVNNIKFFSELIVRC